MMEYSPFLKFKNGELSALFNMHYEDKKTIVPLMELPRDDNYTIDKIINRIDNSVKKMKKKIEYDFSFYIDNYEIPDIFKIKSNDNYLYLINSFSDFDIIPVIGFDREDSHNNIGIEFANKKARKIAIRVTQDYFENILAYKEDLKLLFTNVEKDVFRILLLDCNYIEDIVVDKCKVNIIRLLENILKDNYFSKIVISGSSIPVKISDVVQKNTDKTIIRNEVYLYKEVIKYFPKTAFVFGDYTIVSPGYSEISIKPEAILSVITPKIIYSLIDSHFISRGQRIKSHGIEQYFTQARTIIKKPFFRGKDYSWGDNYLFEKATYKGKNITPSAIIGPTVNAHIKFMINEIRSGSI
jgi:hypothetical protein